MEKQCSGCDSVLPATTEFFARAKLGKYGLTAICKVCKSKYGKEYRSRLDIRIRDQSYRKNRRNVPAIHAKLIAQSREYHSRPEVKEHEKAYRQRYKAEHKEEIKTKSEEYNSRPEVIAHKQAYQQARWLVYYRSPGVKERRDTYWRNRKARKKNAQGSHTQQEVREQYQRQKGKCYYCRLKVKWGKHHEEHIIPLARGGSNDIFNIVIACPSCNQRKSNKLPHEFYQGGRLL